VGGKSIGHRGDPGGYHGHYARDFRRILKRFRQDDRGAPSLSVTLVTQRNGLLGETDGQQLEIGPIFYRVFAQGDDPITHDQSGRLGG